MVYKYLDVIINFFIYELIGLEEGKHLTESIWFFVYEVPKVFLLLVLIIFIVGIVRTYFSPEKTREVLKGKSLFTGNIMAAFLGIVTPFCSCSAIPLFFGLSDTESVV